MASRAERFVQISALKAQGWNGEEIAERLNLSRSHVYDILNDPDGSRAKARKDAYRQPCPICGNLMSGHDGLGGKKKPRRCKNCAAEEQKANKRWTREAVITAIQLFAERNGRPPLSQEWSASKIVRGDDYPPLSAVYKSGKRSNAPFTSWSEAVEAAGFPRPFRGVKILARGQGASRMEREWVVFVKEDTDLWKSYEVSAHAADLAINKVAFREGEYYAVLKKSVNIKKVEPITSFKVMASTPGKSD